MPKCSIIKMIETITLLSQNVNNLLEYYRELIAKENKKQNLVSRRDVDNLVKRLIEESLLPLKWTRCKLAYPLLDIGSGAGLPGIPLKIAKPDLCMVLLEANRRKSLFLRRVISMLPLDNIDVACDRAENLVDNPLYLGHFNTVVSRGVGSIQELLNWGLSYLKTGGELILWKSAKGINELRTVDRSGWSDPEFFHTKDNVSIVRFEKTSP